MAQLKNRDRTAYLMNEDALNNKQIRDCSVEGKQYSECKYEVVRKVLDSYKAHNIENKQAENIIVL